MKHKRMAGNLIYPATKIFLAGATATNLSDFMKVVPAASAGTSGLGRFLHLPQNGIVISEDQDTYEIELVEGHEGTKRMVVVTIGNPDACTECSFEYGFGVSQVQYYRRRYEDPKKHITAGYYDRMSNPAAINPTTGKFTDATMQAITARLIELVNTHVGYSPDAGPVVEAYKVSSIVTTGDYVATIGSTTITKSDIDDFIEAALAVDGVIHAWKDSTTVYISVAEGTTLTEGADTTVTTVDGMIMLNGLYVNPSFNVINPVGFNIDVKVLESGRKPYLNGEAVFNMSFNRKHQGSLSHWTRLDQTPDVVFNKRIIRVVTDTHALDGASHGDKYEHTYEVYYPQSIESTVAALFQASNGSNAAKFKLNNL